MTRPLRPVSALRNLGPRSDAAFARAGIASADTLVALGPDAAYRALLAAGTRPHFIGYLAVAMAIEGRDWRDTTPDEKAALRALFDSLRAEKADHSALEAELDRLGLPR